jgi:predicted AAA+ superfamily ATPase
MPEFTSDYAPCRDLIVKRLQEPAPGRIQLLTGPRQVGKTTLLLEIAARFGDAAVYATGDEPDAALPGFWERRWAEAEARARRATTVLLLDEIHYLDGWAKQLKGYWDHLRRRTIPVHIVATGSSALRVTLSRTASRRISGSTSGKIFAVDAPSPGCPPKLVSLNNALISSMHPDGPADQEREPARFGLWLENACLAFAINQGQRVTYWREEPLEVDAVFEGSWGDWAVEIKTGGFELYDLKGLLEFCRRNKKFRPLIITAPGDEPLANRHGLLAISWKQFLVDGPPQP